MEIGQLTPNRSCGGVGSGKRCLICGHSITTKVGPWAYYYPVQVLGNYWNESLHFYHLQQAQDGDKSVVDFDGVMAGNGKLALKAPSSGWTQNLPDVAPDHPFNLPVQFTINNESYDNVFCIFRAVLISPSGVEFMPHVSPFLATYIKGKAQPDPGLEILTITKVCETGEWRAIGELLTKAGRDPVEAQTAEVVINLI